MSKEKRIKVKLVSTAGTGYYKTTTKNKTNTTEKLLLNKFDPRAVNKETGKKGMVVPFKEEKIK